MDDDDETRFVEVSDTYRKVDIALRNALRSMTCPMQDTRIREALRHLAECQ